MLDLTAFLVLLRRLLARGPHFSRFESVSADAHGVRLVLASRDWCSLVPWARLLDSVISADPRPSQPGMALSVTGTVRGTRVTAVQHLPLHLANTLTGLTISTRAVGYPITDLALGGSLLIDPVRFRALAQVVALVDPGAARGEYPLDYSAWEPWVRGGYLHHLAARQAFESGDQAGAERLSLIWAEHLEYHLQARQGAACVESTARRALTLLNRTSAEVSA